VLLAKTLRSRTFHLALLSIAAFGTIVIGLVGFLYYSTTSFVLNRSDRAIAADYAALQKSYERGGRAALIAAIDERVSSGDGLYLLASPSFAPLSGNLPSWPAGLRGASGSAELADNSHSRLRVSFGTLADGSHLLVARNADDLKQFMTNIGLALGACILLLVVLAGFVSVFVTRRTVSRIESINATSREIMERGLDRRIPLHGTRDEWDQLAENLNLMLDRIEILMHEVKQVTDNVAHDLRTPLARMRGRLEKALNRPRGQDDDQALIGETIADLDDVLRIFSSLMRIAKIEASDRTAAFRRLDLTEIAREVVELFDAAAEEKGLHLSITGKEALVEGDRDLLFDALANLVDNAIKHGREGGAVSVVTASGAEGATVCVCDHGPGIPVSEYRHVFKRFYRLEHSRCSPGNGLGLSLVAAIAHLHGARIEMEDNHPGLKISLLLPRSRAALAGPAAERQ